MCIHLRRFRRGRGDEGKPPFVSHDPREAALACAIGFAGRSPLLKSLAIFAGVPDQKHPKNAGEGDAEDSRTGQIPRDE